MVFFLQVGLWELGSYDWLYVVYLQSVIYRLLEWKVSLESFLWVLWVSPLHGLLLEIRKLTILLIIKYMYLVRDLEAHCDLFPFSCNERYLCILGVYWGAVHVALSYWSWVEMCSGQSLKCSLQSCFVCLIFFCLTCRFIIDPISATVLHYTLSGTCLGIRIIIVR